MKRSMQYMLLCLLGTGSLISCTKKTDFFRDNRINPNADAGSSIRIVNMRAANELIVNGQKLSSFTAPNKEGGYDGNTPSGTPFFPENGRMGLTFTIPQRFVSADGYARQIQFASLGRSWPLQLTRGFDAKDDANQPKDYYYVYFSPNAAGKEDSLFAIPRPAVTPSKPDHFKVRLVNLSSDTDPQHGPLTLTLADGTPVTGINNVAIGKNSDYVELPYGTYQFRVMTADGRQLPGVGGGARQLNVLEPQTGSMLLAGNRIFPPRNGYTDSKLYFAPIRTFQPGGVYTIAVASCPNFITPTYPGSDETVPLRMNAFRIVTDVEPLNTTYGRMQAINVQYGKEVNVTIDGKSITNTLAYTKASPYSTFITGAHQVQVKDKAGNLLAEQSLSLSPLDNITIWIYAKADGNTGLSLVANNMSGKYYNDGGVEDGSYSIGKDDFPAWVRFMHFCDGLPEATFSQENNQMPDAAAQHLLPGVAMINAPYVRKDANFFTAIQAFASKPNVLPGDRLREVAVLPSAAFIANPEMYKQRQPESEAGIFTVALVGSLKPGAPAAAKAKMMIFKHNQ